MTAAAAAAGLLRRAAVPVLIAVPAAGLASYQSKRRREAAHNDAIPALALPHGSSGASAPAPASGPATLPRAFAELAAEPQVNAGAVRTDLPSIPARVVRAANGKGGAPVLVTFGDGVYDVTDFVAAHPGGDHILLAAGGPLEPYWALYAQHAASFVHELLEEHRIGNLERDDAWRAAHEQKTAGDGDGPYANDPKRHPSLIVQSEAPFNAEPQPRLLVATQVTPNALFYVRNHMPVPHIDARDFRLEVRDATGAVAASLTLDELKRRFARHEVAATLQCAGNRRNGLRAVRPVRGGSWEVGAIGNAVWAGARLGDVLDATVGTGWRDDARAQHVCFEGLDKDVASGEAYVTSVPVDVVARHADVLLAYEMNGEALPADHGYPLRAIVPGVTGARNVKWLGAVALTEDESTSRWQRKDYRSFSPNVDWDSMDYDSAPSIHEMPVASAICDFAVEDDGFVEVKGYAWSGDGKGIIRVDVSADGGKTWMAAELLEKGTEKRNRVYDWTLWSARVAIPEGVTKESVELVCKAVDSAYNTQPGDAASVWNPRGLLNNSWHRVAPTK